MRFADSATAARERVRSNVPVPFRGGSARSEERPASGVRPVLESSAAALRAQSVDAPLMRRCGQPFAGAGAGVDLGSRVFWKKYLKGAVLFRGVPMAATCKSVHVWWLSDGPARRPVAAQNALALALTLFE